MTAVPLSGTPQPRRAIRCVHCLSAYAPAEASICDCVTEFRTLRCPSCARCSCSGRTFIVQEHYKHASAEEIQRLREERVQERRPYPAPGGLTRPIIVVADDNFDLRHIVKKLVEDLGYSVVAVADGEEAWNAVRQYRPEIALLDALMPKADGRVISKRIKQDPTLHTKTVVMTSLYTSAAQKDEAFREFLVDEYLAKPVKAEVLKQTLAALLETATQEAASAGR